MRPSCEVVPPDVAQAELHKILMNEFMHRTPCEYVRMVQYVIEHITDLDKQLDIRVQKLIKEYDESQAKKSNFGG